MLAIEEEDGYSGGKSLENGSGRTLYICKVYLLISVLAKL